MKFKVQRVLLNMQTSKSLRTDYRLKISKLEACHTQVPTFFTAMKTLRKDQSESSYPVVYVIVLNESECHQNTLFGKDSYMTDIFRRVSAIKYEDIQENK